MGADVSVRKAAPLSPASVETAPSPDAKQKPEVTIRENDCSASIWKREHAVRGKPTAFYSVTLERSYKDRDGKWKYTHSFDGQALGTIVSLCVKASEAIQEMQKEAVN
jgi:hypothetical protein